MSRRQRVMPIYIIRLVFKTSLTLISERIWTYNSIMKFALLNDERIEAKKELREYVLVVTLNRIKPGRGKRRF